MNYLSKLYRLGYVNMKRNYKAEVRLSRIPRQETITSIDYKKLNDLNIECHKLKKDYEEIAKAFSKILDPMIKAKVPFRTMRNIRDGKYTPTVFVSESPINFSYRVGLIFDIECAEYE